MSASSVLMSAGSISVRLGATRPARNLFQYWNNAIDPSNFMLLLRAICRLCAIGEQKGAPRRFVWLPEQVACQPASAVVHRPGTLRLTKGFDCAGDRRDGTSTVTPRSGRQTGPEAPKSKDLGVSGGSTSRSRETLDGFSFAAARRSRYMQTTHAPDLPRNERIACETSGRSASARAAARAEPAFNLPPVVLALIGICVAVHVVSALPAHRQASSCHC